MEKSIFEEMAPWVGDNARFPRVGDDGFDGFEFASSQVETIHNEACENTKLDTASEIIRALARSDMDSERDFLLAVKIAAESAV